MVTLQLRRKTLNDILIQHTNNFNLLRLFAAIALIYGHAFAFFPANHHIDVLIQLLKVEHSGSVGMYTFFFISGLLVSASFVNSKSVWRFILRRIFRVWPALIVCVLLTVLVLGPLVTNLKLEQYFCSPDTWKYLFTNINLNTVVFNLPGVFLHNSYGAAVNGSLWSLPIEIRCYYFILVLGLLGCLSSKKKINIACIIIFLVYHFHPEGILYFSDKPHKWLVYASLFLLGVFFYGNRKIIILDWKICIPLLLFCLLFHHSKYGIAMRYILPAYALLIVAGSDWLRKITIPGNYSYGLYIYAFIVQQVIALYFPSLTAYGSLLPTIAITWLLAFLSWKYIEKPSSDYAAVLSTKVENILGVINVLRKFKALSNPTQFRINNEES